MYVVTKDMIRLSQYPYTVFVIQIIITKQRIKLFENELKVKEKSIFTVNFRYHLTYLI